MKRIAIVTAVTAALIATPTVAQAGPADRATQELLQEIADDAYQAPPWMLDPRPLDRPYGYADIIVGVTFVVGLVMLW